MSGTEFINLKIEIDNDFNEAMETEVVKTGSTRKGPEDGEICGEENKEKEKDDEHEIQVVSTRSHRNMEDKKQERTTRFGNQSSKTNDEMMKAVFKSLDIQIGDDSGFYRYEAIYFRGIERMSTQDVFEYFQDHKPSSLEWVTDHACNVIWHNKHAALRALYLLSSPIQGMKEYRNKHKKVETSEDVAKDGSSDVPQDEDMEDLSDPFLQSDVNSFNASDITFTIPPGTWRMGVPARKGKSVLVRYATKVDKKIPGAERLSVNYKTKRESSKYVGVKGRVISSVTRKSDNYPSEPSDHYYGSERSRNPWGRLSKDWAEDDRTGRGVGEEIFPYYRQMLRGRRRNPVQIHEPRNHSYLRREQHVHEKPVPRITLRTRNKSPSETSDSDIEQIGKKKMRMRMHADDEEVRIRQKQEDKERKQKEHLYEEQQNDLRRKINTVPEEMIDQIYANSEDTDDDWTEWALEGRESMSMRADVQLSSRRTDVYMKPVRKHVLQRLGKVRTESIDDDAPSDLRSKLNLRKQSKTKAPLKIEIDNDEYYKILESDGDEYSD